MFLMQGLPRPSGDISLLISIPALNRLCENANFFLPLHLYQGLK